MNRRKWIAIYLSIPCAALLHGAAMGQPLYVDVSASHLPGGSLLSGLSMDALPGDVDGDGDLDLVVAQEWRANVLLLNDGAAHFDQSRQLAALGRDSEDIGLADFDGDGDMDLVIVSEDDRINEFYNNDGLGFFSAANQRFPTEGTSNGVVVGDLSGDGRPEILVGNGGPDGEQNRFMLNDGAGFFSDLTAARLPALADSTQDLELGDADGDGDLDLLVGNEDANLLLLNDGAGFFAVGHGRIPLRHEPEETREADFGDVDGDGDLDLFFANVVLFNRSATNKANRLLLNDGAGFYTDRTDGRLPPDQDNSFDGDLVDVDGDGDVDILTCNDFPPSLFRAYLNDGDGRFIDGTSQIFPAGLSGSGFDAEVGDFDMDGRSDIYFSSRGGADRLLLGRFEPTAVEFGQVLPGPNKLEQNAPNPFNGQTLIAYQLTKGGLGQVAIYNLAGQRIRTLEAGWLPAGGHQVFWDGRDEKGQLAASGVYLYKLSVESNVLTRRLTLVK